MSKVGIRLGGIFKVICYGPDGSIKWIDENHNLITNEGLNHILDVVLHGTTPVSPWYVGLKGTGSGAAGDTLASHAGWTEETGYTGDRQEYVEAAASSQSTNNTGNEATFPITGSATIAGAFLSSAASGTSGTLLCVEDFAASRTVANGDTLTVEYTISAADS